MSDTYKKILIATDGSEQNKKAVAHAIELAKLSGAELHAVYVMDIRRITVLNHIFRPIYPPKVSEII